MRRASALKRLAFYVAKGGLDLDALANAPSSCDKRSHVSSSIRIIPSSR
jgi:hypothetical protein